MLSTNQKGAIAEAAVVKEAVKLDIGVWLPFSDHEPHDLILDLGHQLLRVQCKWAVKRGEVVAVMIRRNRRGPNGFVRCSYVQGEIDVVAAYCDALETTYLLPTHLSVERTAIQLRLTRSRNNQQCGVHWARDYQLGATLRQLQGPIAQLGER